MRKGRVLEYLHELESTGYRVRVWTKVAARQHSASEAASQRADLLAVLHWGEGLVTLAEAIADLKFVSAVQVSQPDTTWSPIIYNDWP